MASLRQRSADQVTSADPEFLANHLAKSSGEPFKPQISSRYVVSDADWATIYRRLFRLIRKDAAYRDRTRRGRASLCLTRAARVELLRSRQAQGYSLWNPRDYISRRAMLDGDLGVELAHAANGADIQRGIVS